MKTQITKRQVIVWSILIVLFCLWCWYYYQPKTIVPPRMDTPTHYYGKPKPDMSRNPSHYDRELRKWIYPSEQPSKVSTTKVSYSLDKDEIEEIIQEYLERKIDGYKENTYWG